MENTQQQITPPQPATQQMPTQAKPTGKKKWFRSFLLFLLIGTVFAIVAFAAIFFFVQSQQKISFAPPFPKTSPMPTEITPSATITISPLTPSPKATTSATPT